MRMNSWVIIAGWVFLALDALVVVYAAMQKGGTGEAGGGWARELTAAMFLFVALCGGLLVWGHLRGLAWLFIPAALMLGAPYLFGGVYIAFSAMQLLNSGAKSVVESWYPSAAQRKLAVAIQKGDIPAMKAILASKPDITGAAVSGRNLIVEAIDHARETRGTVEPLRLLAETGVDLNQFKIYNGEPLLSSFYDESYGPAADRTREILEILLEHGINPNLPASKPVMFEFGGNVKTLKVIVDSGANVNIEIGSQMTPLLDFAWQEHWESAQYLVEHGANLGHKTDFGRSLQDCIDRVKADSQKELPPEFYAFVAAVNKRKTATAAEPARD